MRYSFTRTIYTLSTSSSTCFMLELPTSAWFFPEYSCSSSIDIWDTYSPEIMLCWFQHAYYLATPLNSTSAKAQVVTKRWHLSISFAIVSNYTCKLYCPFTVGHVFLIFLVICTFPGLDYKPTSIMSVNVPSISKLQWHPFTITSNSSLEPNTLSIVIKSEGSWSQKLYRNLSSPQEHLDISVEGPYGPTSSHFLR